MPAKKSKLAEIKTKENKSSVEGFLKTITSEQKKEDSLKLLEMMKKASGEVPKMWGTSIVGFGKKIYKSPASGREVEWFKIGFSPRKSNLSVYLVMDLKRQEEELKKLGKHKAGVGCLYINSLGDIDEKVLLKMIKDSLKEK